MRDEATFTLSGPFREVMPLYIKYKRSIGHRVSESELYGYESCIYQGFPWALIHNDN